MTIYKDKQQLKRYDPETTRIKKEEFSGQQTAKFPKILDA